MVLACKHRARDAMPNPFFVWRELVHLETVSDDLSMPVKIKPPVSWRSL